MYSRLGNLGEDASDKREDVEALAVGVLGKGVVVRCFSLVEEGPGPGSPVDTGQGDGASE